MKAAEPITMPTDTNLQRSHVTNAAFMVALGGLFSLLAGFGSQIVIAALFGTGGEMDAYLTALTIPLYLEGVLLSGLAFVLIPAFVERSETGREDEAWALVGTFFPLIGLIMLPLSVALAVFAGPVIAGLAPGLAPAKADLAVSLLRVLAFSTLFNAYRAFTVSIENARGRFFLPAAAGALNSVVQIAVVLLFYRSWGIVALAAGFVSAACAQALVTTIPVWRHGWGYRLSLVSPQVRRLLWLAMPFVLLGLITSLTPILERYYASRLPDGDLSYLGYANRMAMIFQSLIGATIVTAIFPQLTRSLTQEGAAGMLRTFHYGMRLSLAVALPIVAVGSVLAAPLTATLFQRGAFDVTSTLGVAAVLPIFLVKDVLFLMVGNLLTRVFYVAEDTRTVPIITVSSVGLYLVLAVPAVQRWGYLGLAAVDMVRAGVGIVALVALICLRYRYLPWRGTVNYVLRYGAPALAAGTAAYVVLALLQTAPLVGQLLGGGVAATLVYFGLLYWLDASMAGDLLNVIGLQRLRSVQAALGRRNRPQPT